MSTSAAPSASQVSPIARSDYSSSLHRRFLLGSAIAGVISIALLAGGAWTLLDRTIAERGDAMLRESAHRSELVLGDAIDERRRESEVLAMMPVVVATARQGSAQSAALGLTRAGTPALEQRFGAEHSMRLAPETRLLLRQLLPHLDARDLILTDANGYNVLITDRSSDFVQSDEGWWQEAWRTGHSISDAAYDPASRSTVVALSTMVGDSSAKLGVLKVKFDVTPLVASLASAGAGVRVDVVDSTGRVLLSSAAAAVGSTLGGLATGEDGRGRLQSDTIAERAVVRQTTGTRWRVVSHMPDAAIAAPYRSARTAILATAGALLVVLAALLFAMHRFLTRRITTPVGELAEAAEAVAAGNFAIEIRHASSDDEIGRLGRAVGAMILELRALARGIATSTHETNTMSSEITAGSEEMAATAGEIANTASDLSAQATMMAENIGSLAASTGSLRVLAVELESGANEGVARNATLRSLAAENRTGLDASAISLGHLGDDVQASAMAIEALADASNEIRSFVTLVRKLARQSKLLALNAAMEAARAGAQGEGFAVVATEVRRLASMSSDAAERTESVVNGVLKRIEESRASASRAVEMADEVRTSTARASASFTDIERAVAEADAWTQSVQQTAVSASQLVIEMTTRVDELATGTESFAAAMEQVAASSEEQSAATEEIAGAANALVTAADRLNRMVAGLKLGEEHAPPDVAMEIPEPAYSASMLSPLMA